MYLSGPFGGTSCSWSRQSGALFSLFVVGGLHGIPWYIKCFRTPNVLVHLTLSIAHLTGQCLGSAGHSLITVICPFHIQQGSGWSVSHSVMKEILTSVI